MNKITLKYLTVLFVLLNGLNQVKASDNFLLDMMSDTPIESNGRAEFTKVFGRNLISNGEVEILSFNKKNGMRKLIDGVPSYVMFYKAEYMFPLGFNEQCSPEKKRIDHQRRMKNNTWFIGGDPKCRNVEYRKVGEKVEFEGKFIFSMTDNGWQAKDGTIY